MRKVLGILFFVSAPFAASDSSIQMFEQAREIEMLARVVWHEARGEPEMSKKLVAATVIERVRDPRWPDTIEDVVTQSAQFQDFDLEKTPNPWAPGWAECVEAAIEALTSTSSARVNHFHAASITPPWHDPAKVVARAGKHIFLRL